MGIYGYPIEIQALFCFAMGHARQMQKSESDGNFLINNILIQESAIFDDGYFTHGFIELVRELFDFIPMEEKNLIFWNSMISGYAQSEEGLNVAWELFDEMPDRVLYSWNSMINGCVKSGKMDPQYGKTLIHHAILCNNAKAVQVLLKCGDDVEFLVKTTSRTELRPIHLAEGLGFTEVLQSLKIAGCDLIAKTTSEETTLMGCAKYKRDECLKFMILAMTIV